MIDLSGFEQEIEKARRALFADADGLHKDYFDQKTRAGITAFLAAAIESGKAVVAGHDFVQRDFSQGRASFTSHHFPALILKLEPKP